MPKLTLTAPAVERLKAPASGQVDYFDAALPGFGLRIGSSGVRSFFLTKRVNGKLTRVTIGRAKIHPDGPGLTLAAARAEADRLAQRMAGGVNPKAARAEDLARAKAAEAAQARDDFATVFADWFRRDQAENRSAPEVKRLFERDILPAWQGRGVSAITRRDALDLIDGIADRGAQTMARRAHAHLHRLFRWAVGRGVIDANPLADAPKPGREVRRDRVLSDGDMSRVWHACERLGWPFGPAFRLLILTGARREEILALKWSEIDLEGASILLPAVRSKNGQGREIPLAPQSVHILTSLPRIAGAPGFVFTVTGETSVSGVSRAKSRLDAYAAGLGPNGAPLTDAAPLDPWRLHDFRRTAATGLQRLGVAREVVEASLGHIGATAGLLGVYQRHGYLAEQRTALDAWGRHVEALAGGVSGNVLPLPVRRGPKR